MENGIRLLVACYNGQSICLGTAKLEQWVSVTDTDNRDLHKIIIIIRHELGLDRPGSASSSSLLTEINVLRIYICILRKYSVVVPFLRT
jgi:hypothetical protein